MTIAIAWTRGVGPLRELVVASDSRLTGGGHVDTCQKIFPLERGDSFLAFCGDTALAFPLIFQIQSAINNYRSAADRGEDVSKLLGRILQLINAYKDAWKDFDPEVADTDNTITRFLFGGWSWQFGKFFIYPIHYNPTVNEFRAYTHRKKLKRLQLPKTEKCISIGNYVVEFNAYLQAVIKERKLTVLDYEPLEILARMLKTPKFTDRYSHESPYRPGERTGAIGGAPQMIKIYQHSNYRPVAVRWPPEGATKVTLFGRPLFDFEKTLHPIFDIPNREIYYPLSDVKN